MPHRTGPSAHRKDRNHDEIKSEFIKQGFTVKDVHMVSGFCDLIVAKLGYNVLIEIKPNSTQKLTANEQKFHDYWTGWLERVESIMDVEHINGKILHLDDNE